MELTREVLAQGPRPAALSLELGSSCRGQRAPEGSSPRASLEPGLPSWQGWGRMEAGHQSCDWPRSSCTIWAEERPWVGPSRASGRRRKGDWQGEGEGFRGLGRRSPWTGKASREAQEIQSLGHGGVAGLVPLIPWKSQPSDTL